MLISFICTFTCTTCGDPARGSLTRQIRVLRSGLRSVGAGIGFMPARCKRCDTALPDTAEVTVSPNDQPLINAARAKKGWPPVTDWSVGTKQVVGTKGGA